MFTGGKSFVSSPPAFSNDAKRLLVCTSNTVSVFSTSTGLQVPFFLMYSFTHYRIEFRLLHLNLSVFQTCELEGHEAQVTSVIIVAASNPASKVLCYCWTASLDGKINYWDFAAPELMKTIDIRFPIHSMVILCLIVATMIFTFTWLLELKGFWMLYFACYCPLVEGFEERILV